MGNLDFTGALGDITKGTVSLWVRVPSTSAAAAADGYDPEGVDYEVFAQYYKSAANDTATSDVSGYSTISEGLRLVSKIEVFA